MMRRTIFWLHLACGVTAGVVIALMSVTGVLLSYERQILDFADHARYNVQASTSPRLPVGVLIDAVEQAEPEFVAAAVTIRRDPTVPVTISAGRDGQRFVDPYTAEVLGPGATGLRAFFAAVTGWHRWFNVTGDARAPWRAVTGAANLAFLFLISSGLYLWLPKIFRWSMLRTRLWFNPMATSSKARDFNWHHVLGIWSAIPLAIVVATAVVFSYPWANDLVYRSLGEEPPAGRARPRDIAATRTPGPTDMGFATPSIETHLTLDELFDIAATRRTGWRSISMQLPGAQDAAVQFTLDRGNGGQPQLRDTLVLDTRSGEVADWQPFSSQTTGRQVRSWIRYLHTGEALGVAGQSVAAFVSFTSLVMVWTGLALAYRRLILPMLRRRHNASP